MLFCGIKTDNQYIKPITMNIIITSSKRYPVIIFSLLVTLLSNWITTGMNSVKIKQFNIPSTFDLRTVNSTLILDCDYNYNENDLYLVVRWFHQGTTDRPDPIYQWIPDRRVRHIAEDYKSSFDMLHVSDASDPYTMYRSIVLHDPVPSMSGKYKCRISSLANSDSREGNVFIYGEYSRPKVKVLVLFKIIFRERNTENRSCRTFFY